MFSKNLNIMIKVPEMTNRNPKVFLFLGFEFIIYEVD